jgi:hypothetical protein
MPKIQTNCPRCRMPLVAEVEQLFDINKDPQAKQKLLSGSVNVARCGSCGYEGPLATPIVYHDPSKELLLTYFPSELGLPVNEQEKMMGPLINQVVNGLPNEKRKAYLLQPKSMLTLQTLFETILGADGITKEMIADQQKKLNLLQRLITTTKENLVEVIHQEEANIDEAFFAILGRYSEAAIVQGNKSIVQSLSEVQKALVENTNLGKKLKEQSEEIDGAIKTLQEASKGGLTREKLLELLISATTDIRLSTIVGYTRSGLDYVFFQQLTEKIENSQGEEKERLSTLRQKLLDLTQAIDKKLDEELVKARQLLEKILASPDVEKAAEENLGGVNEFFAQVLKTAQEDSRQRGDLERSSKIQTVVNVIEKASAPPPEVELLESLLATENDADLEKMIHENQDKFTAEFLQVLNSIVAQSTNTENPEVGKKLQAIYGAVMRSSMQANLKK